MGNPKAILSIDGQWGSCGKGLLNGYLAVERKPDLVVCNFGPNAGHTYIDQQGRTILTRQLPTGIVNKNAFILIGPGALIDINLFLAEMADFNANFEMELEHRLFIHPHACVVLLKDRVTEQTQTKGIASTMKGTGAALQRKIARPINQISVAKDVEVLKPWVITINQYNDYIDSAKLIQIESAQGVDLSLNHGVEYPYVTSRDVTPESILNDVAVPRRYLDEVYAVYRVNPIRVGNIEEEGKQVGFSGGHYSDQIEMAWSEIRDHVANKNVEEKTTVTGRVRRVFTWSWDQFHKTQRIIGPSRIFLNFCNYLDQGALKSLSHKIDAKAKMQHGSSLDYIGFGPTHNDIKIYEGGK